MRVQICKYICESTTKVQIYLQIWTRKTVLRYVAHKTHTS
jgi:hypothetical protein